MNGNPISVLFSVPLNGKGKKDTKVRKSGGGGAPSVNHNSATMESIFFGPSKGGKASSSSSEVRLNCARRVHHEVCSLLLSALESLRSTLAEFGDHLVPAVSFERAKIDYDVAEAGKRLERLSEAAKVSLYY